MTWKHLLHPGATDRTLVADHHDVAGLDPLGAHRVVAGGLGVEDAGRSAVMAPLVAGELDHAALRRDEPRRMARPPVGLIGVSMGTTTFCPGVSSVAAATSAIVRPSTVGPSP